MAIAGDVSRFPLGDYCTSLNSIVQFFGGNRSGETSAHQRFAERLLIYVRIIQHVSWRHGNDYFMTVGIWTNCYFIGINTVLHDATVFHPHTFVAIIEEPRSLMTELGRVVVITF